jgi:glycosyltransferase involved in cell wall biosynthesis
MKIKAYLQYPWKVSDSQYYKNLIEYPPEEIEYLDSRDTGAITKKKKFILSNYQKTAIRRISGFLNLPFPNIHLTSPNKDCDVIHCAHCLSLNRRKPWVADFEGLWQTTVSGKNSFLSRKIVGKILERKNCKKILVWTEEAKKEFVKNFPKIKEKLEIVPFALPLQKISRKKKDRINLLFISRYFHEKGGLEALDVMDYLTKNHKEVFGTFISDIPEEVLRKYSSNKKIDLRPLTPHEVIMKEIYPNADILIYPGFSDSFGFAMPEAMSFGIPIITVDGFARKEIVEQGKTGFVVDSPKKVEFSWDWAGGPIKITNRDALIKDLVKHAEELINNKELLEKMSIECRKVIKEGKFSLKERNKKMRKIYEEALK